MNKEIGRNFYCIHPIGGTIFCYTKLAKLLEPDISFYPIQSKGLLTDEKPLQTVEEMARYYITLINEHDLGDCLLGGWSFGAIVAFEMVKQLNLKHKRISQLILIDPYLYSDLEFNLLQLSEVLCDQNLIVKFFRDLVGVPLYTQFSKNQLKKALHSSQPLMDMYEIIRQTSISSQIFSIDDIILLFNIFKSNVIALSQYEPESYNGSVVIIRPYQTLPECTVNPNNKWEQILDQKPQFCSIPGDHYNILNTKNVVMLANAIKHFL